MQYILSEEEFKRGYRLIESCRKRNLLMDEAYKTSDELNGQGYFTVVEESGECELGLLFEVIVYSQTI